MKVQIENVLAQARAHEIAVANVGGRRQAHVSITAMGDTGKVYSFKTCYGHCIKCDGIWINVRMLLRRAGVKVVDVRASEAAAPPHTEVLPD